jgi:hypothetical protein
MNQRETMATSSRPDRRAAAVEASRRARPGRKSGDVAAMRAAAAAGALARELRDEADVADDGTLYRGLPGGRVRMTEPPEPAGDRDMVRARRYGYEGSDAELAARGREIKAALRDLDRDELDGIIERYRDRVQALLAEDDGDDEDDADVELTDYLSGRR